MPYSEWLKRYKGKLVEEVILSEHSAYLKQFKAWQIGNMERV